MTTNLFRVFYISPGGLAGRGGMGSVARCLLHQFKDMSLPIDCKVIDSYGPGAFYLMPFYFLAALTRLKIACLLRRVDVVHIHMSHRGSVYRKLFLMRVAAFFGVPSLLHIHGSEFELFSESLSPQRRQWLKDNLNVAARIVVLGNHWRNYLIGRLGIDPAKVAIVYNGVDIPEAAASPASHERCQIIALGVMSKRKGTPELLEALASPAMKSLRWTALLAGNGDVDFYRAEAARLGIADRVEMPGWIAPVDAKRRLMDADIFVLPSHNEGLPMAILEAMAAGVPVVTTPVGAIADLVLPGETGLLVPPGQANALADALAELVTQPSTRVRMGENARKRVTELFNSRLFAHNIAQLYRDLYQIAFSHREKCKQDA